MRRCCLCVLFATEGSREELRFSAGPGFAAGARDSAEKPARAQPDRPWLAAFIPVDFVTLQIIIYYFY